MDDDDDWDDAVWSTIDALETSHLQRQQAADAQWACRSCTLLNSAARATCSICNTPRDGQGNQSSEATHPKKTVQATLPFAKTGASGRPTVAAPSQRTNNCGRRPVVPNVTPVPRGSVAFPLRVQPNSTSGVANDDDMDDEPLISAAGIAVAARLRHKGEDPNAKMRYLTDAPLHRRHPAIDREAARTFVYPTNYSVREYQLTIAERALYHNTLVSLPTGLGKTLIASVVMYNFYRWFPDGQIVFMAPTKPLVAQQIGACHEIMGIPLSDTAELQGSVPPSTRKVLWSSKRVFFCTPQSMQNDLQRGVCRADRLVCLVVDEAHRATGNYAYCGVIQEVEKSTKHFRVLALSATPGAKFDVIQDVIQNLRITHIESRTADDSDVKKYTHARQEEVIKCSLNSQIAETKTLFVRVFERITQRLLVGNIIQHKDPDRLTRWYVLQMRDKFRASPNYNSNRSAESDLALLVSLLHARDLLTAHGLSSFKKWLNEIMLEEQEKGKRPSWSKKELLQSTEFQALRLSLEHISAEETASSSHPKLLKLREVLHEHFQRHSAGQSSTRAIVFTQYRSSVQEIVKLLGPLFPLIKAQQFIGQGASGKGKDSKGQTQKEQQEIVRKFRAGLFNVLVATCIAEEGLDIGEVDLIVSFDALTSPVRMIQRMGRTGRKRVGKVVILVTEGDEEKKLARSVASAKTVSRALTTFKSKFVYSKCARMVPHDISPELAALEMDIPEFHASQIAGKQTMSRSTRTDGDGVAERKDTWKLNELERSIVRGKYTTPNWINTPRKDFLPITASRKVLLRQRRPEEQSRPTCAKSRALLTLMRKINGVQHDDQAWEVRRSAAETPLSCILDAYPVIGQHNDEVLEFSDPDDPQMHYSPPPSGTQLAPEPATPVRSEGARTPRGIDTTNQVTRTTSILEIASASGMRVSPLRQSTLTGKPSPSPSRRSSVGSGRKVRRKVDKPRDAIDEGLLERGERLLVRLNAMLNDPGKSSVEATSPEPEPPVLSDDITAVDLRFPLPRIARRLDFDDANQGKVPSALKSATHENCVPPPPSLSDIFFPRKTEVVKSAVEVLHQADRSTCDSTLTLQTGKDSGKTVESERTDAKIGNSVSTILPPSPKTLSDESARNNPDEFRVTTTKSNTLVSRADSRGSFDTELTVSSRPKKPKRSLALRAPPPDEAIPDNELPATTMSGATQSVQSTKVNHRSPVQDEFKAAENSARQTLHGVEEDAYNSRNGALLSQRRSTQMGATQGEPCSVCCEHESFDDDPIVFCDGCDTAVHQFCYGIPVLPSDDWYCDSCREFSAQGKLTTEPKPRRCALCPMRNCTFAMKQTECEQWVHVQCFMWIPELQFHFQSSKLVLGALRRLDSDRRTLNCSLCQSKRGYGIIQCAHKRCLNAFHVSCASAASDQNYKLVQLDHDEGHDERTLFIAYCPLHNKSTAVWKPTEKTECVKQKNGTPSRSPARPSALSPSMLLASQLDSSKKQRKQFRRLKRKYDTAISKDGSTERTPPSACSPWAKRVRRSQHHAEGKRAQAKVLARMFIDDEVEAPSSGSDDDGEDDEMDEEDRDFINDSSQLIYSQSVPTPERKRKNKRNSLGEMRAIYARSLIESPQTPAFLRRGRGNIPSGGIINACLQELKGDRDELKSPSSCSQKSRSSDQSEMPDGIEIMDESPAKPHQEEGDTVMVAEAEPSIPCFDLLEMAAADPPLSAEPLANGSTKSMVESTDADTNDEVRQMQEKIEANRLKALMLLEAKQNARRLNEGTNSTPQVSTRDDTLRDKISHGHSETTHRSAAVVNKSSAAVDPTPTIRTESAAFSAHQKAQHTVPVKNKMPDLTSPSEVDHLTVYVQPAFRESRLFDVLEACAPGDADPVKFEAIESLAVNAVLSLRVAAILVDLDSFETNNLDQHPMVKAATEVYKSFLLVVRVRDHSALQVVSQSERVRQLREMPSCRSVIVACEAAVICKVLLDVARDEARMGFSLPSTNSTRIVTAANGVDVNFHERFSFFRSTGLLSIGSVISLSFRFNKFTVKQIPVAKFSEMHWHRMLPWIPKSVAKQLHSCFVPSGG